jgi:hypothetical protein
MSIEFVWKEELIIARKGTWRKARILSFPRVEADASGESIKRETQQCSDHNQNLPHVSGPGQRILILEQIETIKEFIHFKIHPKEVRLGVKLFLTSIFSNFLPLNTAKMKKV